MQYLKHYWTDGVGNYQTVKNQAVDRRHPLIDGIQVKYWLTDERGIDYCLSVCPDTTLIDTPPAGIQVLSKEEWDSIVATIPPPPGPPEQPKPNWSKFRSSIANLPEMKEILAEAIQTVPQDVVNLTLAVYQLDTGNYEDFKICWNQIMNSIDPTLQPERNLDQIRQGFKELARSYNLPDVFVDIL